MLRKTQQEDCSAGDSGQRFGNDRDCSHNGIASVSYDLAKICLLVALACALFAPEALPGQEGVYQRCSVFVWFSMIWIASKDMEFALARPMFRYAVMALTLLHVCLWSNYFLNYDRTVGRPFAELLQRKDLHEASLSAIICDNKYLGKTILLHLQNYQIIWNNGVAPTKSAEYRFRLLRPKENAHIPKYEEWLNDGTVSQELLARYSGMEFLLLRGAKAIHAVMASADYAMVAERNGWALVRKMRKNGSEEFTH